MKEIKNVKEEVFITYEAIDGTIFKVKEECEKYEKTCECLLMVKYNQIPKVSCSEYDITKYIGSEDFIFDIVKLRNDDDIDIIIQLFKLRHSNHAIEVFDSLYESLQKHMKLGSHILIERGNDYDDNFYISPAIRTLEEFIMNMNSVIETIESIINPTEKNEDENNN